MRQFPGGENLVKNDITKDLTMMSVIRCMNILTRFTMLIEDMLTERRGWTLKIKQREYITVVDESRSTLMDYSTVIRNKLGDYFVKFHFIQTVI